MINNLVEYLRVQLPLEAFYINNRSNADDRCVLVMETGGGDTPWFHYETPTFQILCRDIDSVTSRELAYKIYKLLHGRFGLTLPTITVNSIVYAAKQTAQIKAITKPQGLGFDDNNRFEFTTNYQIVYKEEV